jgi:hypothetical protein
MCALVGSLTAATPRSTARHGPHIFKNLTSHAGGSSSDGARYNLIARRWRVLGRRCSAFGEWTPATRIDLWPCAVPCNRPQFPVDCGMANRRSSHEHERQDQGAEGR